MELIAVSLARLVAFVEIQGFDPRGRTSAPAGLKRISDRYSFIKAPQTFEEFNFEKGVEFFVGKFGDINIDKLTLFGDGLTIDTRSSSDDCEAVLADLLAAVKEANGITLQPSRRMHLSNVIFRSNLRLSSIHAVMQMMAERVSVAVSKDFRQDVQFEPNLVWSADTSQLGLKPNPFTIEHRINVPFSENTYFSAAPLATSKHLELLQQLENALGS